MGKKSVDGFEYDKLNMNFVNATSIASVSLKKDSKWYSNFLWIVF